jgi:NDP-sugar pyrophosphorylase family protein
MLPCVILAGGLATRMRPLTETIPKAMVLVNGRPFVDLQLSWLRAQGVTDVVFCIAHLGDQIVAHVGDGSRWAMRVRYSNEGDDRLGTAGALRLAADRGLVSDDVFVLYGDSYLQLSLVEVEVAYRTSRRPALMTVYHNLAALERCNVRYVDGVVAHYEKGVDDPSASGMFHVDYGLQVYSCRTIVDRVPADRVVDLSDVQRSLSLDGLMAAFEVRDRYYEIGSPAGRQALEDHLQQLELAWVRASHGTSRS